MPKSSLLRSRRPQASARQVDRSTAGDLLLLAKAVCLLAALVLFVANWTFFKAWLGAVSHLEFAGLKVDRHAAEDALTRLSQKSANESLRNLTETDRRELLSLGLQVSKALDGARILWVDPSPTNNDDMQRFFEAYGVKVQRAIDTPSALVALRSGLAFDLIVTSSREGEPLINPDDLEKHPKSLPLRVCPVLIVEKEAGDAAAINETQLASFAMIEWLHTSLKWLEPVVLYSAKYGGRSSGPCMFSTNYTGDFARHVLFALAHKRWTRIEQDHIIDR